MASVSDFFETAVVWFFATFLEAANFGLFAEEANVALIAFLSSSFRFTIVFFALPKIEKPGH